LKREVQSYRFDNLEITLDRQGADRFQKISFPIRYGRFCEIKTSNFLMGDRLSEAHYHSLIELGRNGLNRYNGMRARIVSI
jgi:hypothetical protein